MSKKKSSGKPIWFPFFPDSWLSSNAIERMGPAGEGAYIRLLARCWMEPDCGLPDDDEELAILSRLGQKDWSGRIGKIIRSKFRSENGRLYNDKLLEEFRTTKTIMSSGAKGGHNSGVARREKAAQRRLSELEAQAKQFISKFSENGEAECEASAKQSPSESEATCEVNAKRNEFSSSDFDEANVKQTPSKVRSEVRSESEPITYTTTIPPLAPPRGRVAVDPDLVEDFHRWIAKYPKKVKVDTAMQAWISLCDLGEITAANVAEVHAGLDRYIASEQWAREGGKFIPEPKAFLAGNGMHMGRMWKDFPPASAAAKAESRGMQQSSEGIDAYAEWVPRRRNSEEAA